MMKKILISASIIAIAALTYADSKYDADATADGATVIFKAKSDGWNVKAVQAVAGASGKQVDIWARYEGIDMNPQLVTALDGNYTNMTVVNTGSDIDVGSTIVYQHKSGVADVRTVTVATASNLCISVALSATNAVGDKVYEITKQGAIYTGETNGSGQAISNVAGDALYTTPSDSPLYVVLDSGTNNFLTVTAE